MARIRTISPDFWTSESIADCTPMARLLLIGLSTFADDFGVLPLRPRTIRLQVFPADEIGGDTVRAMIDELAAQGLVRIYNAEGQDYVAIVGWDRMQRVGKRARRRYPADTSPVQPLSTIASHRNVETVRDTPVAEAGEQPSLTIANSGNVETVRDAPADETNEQPPPTIAGHGNGGMPENPASGTRQSPEPEGKSEPRRWREQLRSLLRSHWHRHATIESVDDETAERWTAKWIAEGLDYRDDIVPAVRDFYIMQPSRPPADLRELDARLRRPAMPA
jgi:hypothetical protein